MKKNFNKGFTLIELVIIMVILGVLAAVAVPRLGSTIDSSEASAEEAVIGSLKSALEVYAMDQVVNNSTKSYPSNPFDALDNNPVDLIVFLILPEVSKPENLQILAQISRLLRNTEITDKLRGCKSEDSAFAIISQHLKTKAA